MRDAMGSIIKSQSFTWDAHNKQLHEKTMEYYWLNSDMLELDRSLYPLCQLRLKDTSDGYRTIKQYTSLTPNDNNSLLNSVKKFFNDIFIKWLY